MKSMKKKEYKQNVMHTHTLINQQYTPSTRAPNQNNSPNSRTHPITYGDDDDDDAEENRIKQITRIVSERKLKGCVVY